MELRQPPKCHSFRLDVQSSWKTMHFSRSETLGKLSPVRSCQCWNGVEDIFLEQFLFCFYSKAVVMLCLNCRQEVPLL